VVSSTLPVMNYVLNYACPLVVLRSLQPSRAEATAPSGLDGGAWFIHVPAALSISWPIIDMSPPCFLVVGRDKALPSETVSDDGQEVPTLRTRSLIQKLDLFTKHLRCMRI
jgi:hypothetical protein